VTLWNFCSSARSLVKASIHQPECMAEDISLDLLECFDLSRAVFGLFNVESRTISIQMSLQPLNDNLSNLTMSSIHVHSNAYRSYLFGCLRTHLHLVSTCKEANVQIQYSTYYSRVRSTAWRRQSGDFQQQVVAYTPTDAIPPPRRTHKQ
jgi:hypothetical protein